MTGRADTAAGMRWRLTTRDRQTDREFLPAALEILETPPSPVKIGLLVAICGVAVAAVLWSYVSYIDIIAVAQGKIQPTGRVKVIQPLDTSRVLMTRVENGATVKAGQVLIELDSEAASADANGLAAELASSRAEALRRQAAIDAVSTPDAVPQSVQLGLAWPDTIPAAIRQREERVYTADMLQLRAQISSLRAQAEQKKAEAERLRMMIAAQGDLINTIQTRVGMRQRLVELEAGSKLNLLDATESLQSQRTALAQQTGQLAESVASLAVSEKEIRRVVDTFVADNAQKLATAERAVGDLTERYAKASARLAQMDLRSPIDGTVQALSVTTVGQIVTSGQELMRIVPEGADLEIECYLPNKDIGFVKPGDSAVLKIESFPFTRYGTIDAVVTRVAHDAIPEPDAQRIEADGTMSSRALAQGGAQRTQNLVFPVTLRPSRHTIDVEGTAVPLGAGMAVTAEIRTGSRRVLEYVFSPLAKVGSEAMKER